MDILYFGKKNDFYSISLYNYLKKFSYKCKVVWSDGKNNIFKRNIKNYDYIICFRSHYILKKKHINKARIACINFHPGTPKYRGIGCANLAIINKEKKYGTTAHLIDEKIDHGKILDIKYFKLKPLINLEEMLKMTHKIMYLQAKKLLKDIIKKKIAISRLIKKNKNKKWSKNIMTRKKLENLYSLKLPIKKNKLINLLRGLEYKSFKPYFKLKNKKYFISGN